MDITDVASAAKKLGMAEQEISSVEETLHGPVVHMVDGSSYIDIEDADAKGQTGLAYFKAPCEGYAGAFPVFATEPDPVIPAESEPAVTAEPAATTEPAVEPVATTASTESPVPVKGQTAPAEPEV